MEVIEMSNSNHNRNVTLASAFGPVWEIVTYIVKNGQELHVAHDACKILGLKNVSLAVLGGKNGICNVSPQYRTMARIPKVNRRRTVHVLNFKGVLQLIMN